jgi:hypothetical protein
MLTDEKTDALLKTVAYLSRHDLMGVLLLVHDSENARQIAKFAVQNSGFQNWLNQYDLPEMKRIVEKWAEIYA